MYYLLLQSLQSDYIGKKYENFSRVPVSRDYFETILGNIHQSELGAKSPTQGRSSEQKDN